MVWVRERMAGMEFVRSGLRVGYGGAMYFGGCRVGVKAMVAAFACFVVAFSASVFFASSAMAHGVEIEQSRGEAVEISASFDTGEPMSEGQVTIYSPEDPSEPWATGTTDEDGQYVFMPDESKPGSWSVQVREAGHGANVAVEVGGDAEPVETERTSSVGGNPLQTWVMAALGLWGFVGTALFFRSRRA